MHVMAEANCALSISQARCARHSVQEWEHDPITREKRENLSQGPCGRISKVRELTLLSPSPYNRWPPCVSLAPGKRRAGWLFHLLQTPPTIESRPARVPNADLRMPAAHSSRDGMACPRKHSASLMLEPILFLATSAPNPSIGGLRIIPQMCC